MEVCQEEEHLLQLLHQLMELPLVVPMQLVELLLQQHLQMEQLLQIQLEERQLLI